jgi:glycosyltransferase involved in cell wall biosynthesis
VGKIRVGFQLGEWTYAGTARSHFRILEALDRDRFEPFALVWRDGQNDLLPALQRVLGDHVIFYERSQARRGHEDYHRPESTNFEDVVAGLNLDILHGARGGYPEWPLSTGRHARLQVETNIFGDLDPSPTLDRTISICHYIARRRGRTDAVIYNPIPPAELEGPNLRAELGIPEDAIVCGRIGRPANFDPIAIEAFVRVQEEIPNLCYLVVAPPEEMVKWGMERRVPNCICFAPRTDDAWIAKFHRTLDIFLHFRSDGEVHSTAIAQAMMYGIPVISHKSRGYNGQSETLGMGGYVADDLDAYTAILREMAKDKWLRDDFGKDAVERAQSFLQSTVVRQIEEKYIEWLR